VKHLIYGAILALTLVNAPGAAAKPHHHSLSYRVRTLERQEHHLAGLERRQARLNNQLVVAINQEKEKRAAVANLLTCFDALPVSGPANNGNNAQLDPGDPFIMATTVNSYWIPFITRLTLSGQECLAILPQDWNITAYTNVILVPQELRTP